MDILFVAKTPVSVSVEAGHYFQGKQGTTFWNKLKEYGILKVPPGGKEDDCLLDHKYGITDIVKVPRDYGNEPSEKEYEEGTARIMGLIKKHEPEIVFFVYKAVLENSLKYQFPNQRITAQYGINKNLESFFGCKVFVFPMPGVGGLTREEIDRHLADFRLELERMKAFKTPLTEKP
ncbi:MAG: hypothetical protein NTX88_10065 [Candidatus Atribacteria bacterium]|nr:hypothetical protein [Candidatus Atribacteria bacterium]